MREAFLFILLCLASFRLQHFITSDTFPGEWGRGKLFMRLGEDSNYRERIEELLSCHYCFGTWLTLATFAVAAQIVSLRLPVLQALAGAAVVGLLGEWETK